MVKNTVIVTVSGGVAEVYAPSLPHGWSYAILDLDTAESENVCAACNADAPGENLLCERCSLDYGEAVREAR